MTFHKLLHFATGRGVQFAIGRDGTLLGTATAIAKPYALSIVNGETHIATQHSALGMYTNRTDGKAVSVKASAKWYTLKEAILRDPRFKGDQQAARTCWKTVQARYAQ